MIFLRSQFFLRENGACLIYLGSLNLELGALLGLLGELSTEGLWQWWARVSLDPVGSDLQLWPGVDALAWSGNVSLELVVEVSADSAQLVLEQWRWQDLDVFAVSPELVEQQLWALDDDNTVDGPGDSSDGLLDGSDGAGDLDNLAGWDGGLLAVNDDLWAADGGWAGWDELDGGGLQVELDLLLVALQRTSSDAEPLVLGAVSGQDMEALVLDEGDGLVVVGGDGLAVNQAGLSGNGSGGDLVQGKADVVAVSLQWEEQGVWVLDVDVLEVNELIWPADGQVVRWGLLLEGQLGLGGVSLGLAGNGGAADLGLGWSVVWPQVSLQVRDESLLGLLDEAWDGSVGGGEVNLVETGSLLADLLASVGGQGSLDALLDQLLALLGLSGVTAESLLLVGGQGGSSGLNLGLAAGVWTEGDDVVEAEVDVGRADLVNVPHWEDWQGQVSVDADGLDWAAKVWGFQLDVPLLPDGRGLFLAGAEGGGQRVGQGPWAAALEDEVVDDGESSGLFGVELLHGLRKLHLATWVDGG